MNASTEYLSERAVSQRLGVSQPTLRRWRRASIGPGWTRLGPARIGYNADTLAEWLAAQTRAPIAA